MPLDFNELRQLLATIAQTDIAEVTLKTDEFEIAVRKAVSFTPPPTSFVPVTNDGSGAVLPSSTASNLHHPIPEASTTRSHDNSGGNPPSPPSTASEIDSRWVEATSPMVGTFYRAAAPGEAPFVEVGTRVRKGQTICIIEAMKLMNEIEAEVSGQVMEILVQNGEPVEYGQPLVRINPD